MNYVNPNKINSLYSPKEMAAHVTNPFVCLFVLNHSKNIAADVNRACFVRLSLYSTRD